MTATHISPYRGQWYPESVPDLESLLDEKYAESRRRTGDSLTAGLGFVVPHAGPAYSGTVAAAVYRTLEQQQVNRVVLLAFPHHGLLRGVAVPEVNSISTPLGVVEIDRQFAGSFRAVPESRLCDHSFEIQLPFLQRSVPRALLTPLYIGSLTPEERAETAAILAAAWQPGTVFLASSDFTHYGREFACLPFPVDRHTAANLHDLDFEFIEAAATLSAARFLETLEHRGGNVCGSGPIALLLSVLQLLNPESLYPATLDYQTSGELTGDFHHSVSYAALGFHPASAFHLDPHDRQLLLESAAETLRRLHDQDDRRGVPATCGSPALAVKRGAFVSLHRGEELLGCIGNLAGRHPLATEISHLTLSAALEDPRFRPAIATPGPIDIEISILTPFRRIFTLEDFSIGRHGGFLTLGARSGLLLPQVAEGRGWTAANFVHALERKSGLWKDAWRDPKARLDIFEAQVFSSGPVPL